MSSEAEIQQQKTDEEKKLEAGRLKVSKYYYTHREEILEKRRQARMKKMEEAGKSGKAMTNAERRKRAMEKLVELGRLPGEEKI